MLPTLKTVVVIVIRAGTVLTTIVVATGVVMLVVSQIVEMYWEQKAAPNESALMDETASDRHEQLAAATCRGKSGIMRKPKRIVKAKDCMIVDSICNLQITDLDSDVKIQLYRRDAAMISGECLFIIVKEIKWRYMDL